MIVPINELKKCLRTDVAVDRIVHALTRFGLEVEDVVDYAKIYKGFVVGEVITAEKHSNADKLNVCMVKVGSSVNQIVCGADNVRAGIFVVVSLENAVIPKNGLVIKKTTIRGIESNGMICSASELGLSAESEGILELEGTYTVGDGFAEAVLQNDVVLHLGVTPDRGDCNSLMGIARVLHAAGLGDIVQDDYLINSVYPFPIQINNKVADIFSAVCVRNIKNISAPQDIRVALFKMGISSHNLVVDVSNLVMMITGCPIHIYDADKIGEKLDVCSAIDAKFIDLKGREHSVTGLTVTNQDKVLALLGIMGSKDSCVDIGTKNIMIECAYINPVVFARNAKDIAIKTDARYRFERGVDPGCIGHALHMAAFLVHRYCGGKISMPYMSDIGAARERVIVYDIANYRKLIGMDIDTDQARVALHKLGFRVDESFFVSVPSYRHDISIAADITAEIASFNGLDTINCKYALPYCSVADNSMYDKLLAMKNIIACRGMMEVVNFSFIDKADVVKLGHEILLEQELANPMSANMNYMRPSLLIGLLNNIAYNIAKHKIENMALFEEGAVFLGSDNQKAVIAGVMTGNAVPDDHFKESRPFDLFDAKSVVESIVRVGKIKSAVAHFAHPYRYFHVYKGDLQVAAYGEIHPRVLKQFGLSQNVIFFEVFPDIAALSSDRTITEMTNLHPIVKDMAFIVPEDIMVGDMVDAIYATDCGIAEVIVCDVYSGEGIDVGFKSIMFRFQLEPQHDLSGDDINALMVKVCNKIENGFAAKLRGQL